MHELLRIATHAASMSAVRDVLRVVAEKTESYGCILWRIAPAESGERKYLFVAADWFPGEQHNANYSLPLDGSVTGRAITAGAQQVSSAIPPEPDPFLVEAGISAICSTPITFGDNVQGAVNLYKREHERSRSEKWPGASEYASIVPDLLLVIAGEVSLRLLKSIDPVLGDVSAVHVETAMERMCREIAEALHCVEASVFFADDAGEYRLAGTSRPDLVPRGSYRADARDGVTGWSLAHPHQPVLLFDFGDTNAVERKYPGMQSRDSLLLRKEYRQPLSFMSVPIIEGSTVIGLLRCSIGLGPVYFDERQVSMLQQVAARLAPAWTAFVRNRSLAALVKRIRLLNSVAHEELLKEAPDETRIFDETLRIVNDVIPGVDTTDVRVLSNDGRELRFASVKGHRWREGAPEEQNARRNRVFRIHEDPPRSAGAHVVQTGQTYVVHDPKEDPYYNATFAEAKRMIIVPAALGSDVYGVLDIRSSNARDFPEFTIAAAELLGSQLALYQRLAMVVRDLNQRARDLNALRQQQIQIYEDLAHQLKSPTMAAHARISRILRALPQSELTPELLSVRGLCSRAMHVTANAGLFARLARNEPMSVSLAPMTGEELRSLIINTAQDAAYLARGKSHGDFWVKGEGFDRISRFPVDRNLLEQAMTQLLDNAFKYSYRDAAVIVDGGYSRSAKTVRISVGSEGVRLDPADVSHVVQRGWQSEEARMVSDSGSGIGLWIVDHIMKAHGGNLEIAPTDAKGRTVFTLLFPAEDR